MTDLIYMKDSYKRELATRVVSAEKRGPVWEIELAATVFYPEGGGQPSDKGIIKGPKGKARVKHVRMKGDRVIHECSLEGTLSAGDEVTLTIDWELRYAHMRLHSAGHIVHEAVKMIAPSLVPDTGQHGDNAYIEYRGSLPIDRRYAIEKEANRLVEQDLPITTEMVSFDELQKRSPWAPEHLPKNKPLRIMSVGDLPPIPDGGTQVKHTGEVGPIAIGDIVNEDDRVRVYYGIEQYRGQETNPNESPASLTSAQLTGMLLDAQREAVMDITASDMPAGELKLQHLGGKSTLASLTKQIRLIPPPDRQSIGVVVAQVKRAIEEALGAKTDTAGAAPETGTQWFDVTAPGMRPPQGHLHIVTQAIFEITDIFSRIGFTRVRHPEVDWDWYPFEALNMPPNHPARDEWETFFIDYPGKPASRGRDPRKQKMVLTPHTSNGQVREMEKGRLPIRMINIAKCYRRQIDVSHTPMFHQFEGLYIDHDVSIAHLKGVFDYFAKAFFGSERKTRLRPFHFQFTEPSFEVDITCGICNGTGVLKNGEKCRLCKSGWLELGGSGMVHPTVLRNGGIDPDVYSGFAFGWGIERTYMMKSGTSLDDIRLLYSNDMRFLTQF